MLELLRAAILLAPLRAVASGLSSSAANPCGSARCAFKCCSCCAAAKFDSDASDDEEDINVAAAGWTGWPAVDEIMACTATEAAIDAAVSSMLPPLPLTRKRLNEERDGDLLARRVEDNELPAPLPPLLPPPP